jgi:hypothetical protein
MGVAALTRSPALSRLAAAALLLGAAGRVSAQGYRLRLDTRMQVVGYRGVTLDSIPVADTVGTPGQGPTSPDGFAVQCVGGDPYCTFFRPGPVRRSTPITTTADLTVWGLGAPGVSVHVSSRLGVDAGTAGLWPGTHPAVQLLEGYAEYAERRGTARLGRQVVASRLGTMGFDGAGVVMRDARRGLEVEGYLGWGLARGAALPVTSPALNPLDEFRPDRRQILAGAAAGWRSAYADFRADYQREVDPRSDYFVSERVGLDAAVRPLAGLRLSGGADYDLAAGWWGSAEATVGYAGPTIRGSFGARRYRPHFDLWTIWGAFSPVPYHAVQGTLAVTATSRIELRGRYERYEYDPSETSTPLLQVTRDGWRWEIGGTATPLPGWSLDAGYHREFGPGAAAVGLDGSVSYRPSPRINLSVMGSTFDRPLEFRFNDAVLHAIGIDAQLEPTPRVRLGLTATRYEESHHRPDAAAFDWNQVRVSARVVVLFGSGADLRGLPPSIRVLPGGRAAR